MLMLSWTVQLALVPVALVFANFVEWFFHKYVLHGLGKRRGSIWNFHWQHHQTVRRHGFLDEEYRHPLRKGSPLIKEVIALSGAVLLSAPFLFVAPLVFCALLWSTGRYYYVHRKCHLDTEWARKNVPWHYDHHMNRDQEANWCVTRPWFDHLFKTRKTDRIQTA